MTHAASSVIEMTWKVSVCVDRADVGFCSSLGYFITVMVYDSVSVRLFVAKIICGLFYLASLKWHLLSSIRPFLYSCPKIVLLVEDDRTANVVYNYKLIFTSGNVAMVERGGCSFLSKSIQAERAGARAVIVYDNNADNDDSYIGKIFSF